MPLKKKAIYYFEKKPEKKRKKKKKERGHFMSIFYSMMTCVAARWAKHLKLRRFKIKVRVKEGCPELSTHKL